MAAHAEVAAMAGATSLAVQFRIDIVSTLAPEIGVVLRRFLAVAGQTPLLCVAGFAAINFRFLHETHGLAVQLLPVDQVIRRFVFARDYFVAQLAIVLDRGSHFHF